MKLTDVIKIEKPISSLYKVWTASIGFIKATGTNSEDATEKVAKNVKLALSGSYQPTTIVYKGWLAVIFRQPLHINTWEYTIHKLVDGTTQEFASCTVGTREETERYCRKHFASYLSDEMGLEDASRVILNQDDRENWLAREQKTREAMRVVSDLGIDFLDALRVIETGKR